MRNTIDKIIITYLDNDEKRISIRRTNGITKVYIVEPEKINILKLLKILSALRNSSLLSYNIQNKGVIGDVFYINYRGS